MRHRRWFIAVILSISLLGCPQWRTFEPRRIDDDTFRAWDLDEDGFLDGMEWATGFGTTGVFAAWDRDISGYIEDAEWRARVAGWKGRSDRLEDWDPEADAGLGRNELSTALFRLWDEDDNRGIDADEFQVGRDRTHL